MRRTLSCALLCSFLFFVSLTAQHTTVIPSSFVAGNASVAYDKAWLPFHNPAALAKQKHFGLQLLYENRYITRELSNKALNAWFPTKHLNIGASFSHFGYDQYHEMLAGLSLARRLGDYFSLGVEVDYYTLYLSPAERYVGTVTAQVGFMVYPMDDFTIGFRAFNPVFSKVKTTFTDRRVPTIFSLGAGYKVGGMVDCFAQFDKEVSQPARWAFGAEYEMLKTLTFRLGAYGQQSFVPTLGVGLHLYDFDFDVQADFSAALGVSLLGALRYSFNRK